MTGILDLNDVALTLWVGDQSVHSPGYAWFDGTQYQFGKIAAATSRRTPRAVHTRYWSQLSTQALSPAIGPARHTADLVHGHLQALHGSLASAKDMLVAVSGSMSREQLSLLLGIVGALPFDIAGLVHRSAALGAVSGIQQGCHVELQLHQCVLTPFEQQAGVCRAEDSQVVTGAGLLALQAKLAAAISALFVQQTRFDPLRSADSEQGLHDALPGLLKQLQDRTECQIELNGYSARVTREDLAETGRGVGAQLAALIPDGYEVLMEYPLCQLPGVLADKLPHKIDSDVLGAAIGAQINELRQPADGLTVNRQVKAAISPQAETIAPDISQPAVTIAAPVESPAPPVTHVLRGNVATPLSSVADLLPGVTLNGDSNALLLNIAGEATVLVNGVEVTNGHPLSAGDQIADAADEETATLIHVEL